MAGSRLGAPISPAARPLERLSPSLAEDLRTCGLRVAFHSDIQYAALRRIGPSAALGLVSHELVEAAARGEFDAVAEAGLEEAFTRAWDRHVSNQAAQLATQWPLGLVPPPDRWPAYQLTRVRLLRRLREEVRRPRGHTTGHVQQQVETWLAPQGVPFIGRIDRAERREGEVELVDLKTGWTVAEDIRPAHRRQLLLYAYLWHEVHGEWPRTISIQRLDGHRSTLDVDPGEAQGLASEVAEQLAAYNRWMISGKPTEELASPSSEACAHCSYRSVCLPFFQVLSEEWGWRRRSILGTILDTTREGVVGILKFSVEASNLIGHVDRARAIGIPTHLLPSPGTRVALVDATPTPVPADVRTAWDTYLFLWR